MKTRISKRLLSAVLSVLMIVTSLPIVSFTAFAADEAVDQVKKAMQDFEYKLDNGGVLTNVTPAYKAYVNCQKALDAYIYGGESDALSGKADALYAAMSDENMPSFTTKRATGVPTFPSSPASEMQEWVNNGTISQILYSETASLTDGVNNGQVSFKMVLLNKTVVLYDSYGDGKGNVPQINIPVMFDGYKSGTVEPANNSKKDGGNDTAYGKTRNIFAVYPSQDQEGKIDDTNWNLVGKWNSLAGVDANWNWNWWGGSSQQTNAWNGNLNANVNYENYDPAYNAKTGCAANGVQQTDKSDASKDLQMNRTGNYGVLGNGYRYTSIERFHSNVMRYVGGKISDTSASITTTIPYWYCSSGDGANSSQDSKTMGGNSITLINYDYVTSAITANTSKMDKEDLDNYSEGGVADFLKAIDDATSWDPNNYFSTSDTQSCTQSMSAIVRAMNYATMNANSADYAELRTSMSDSVRATYAAGNINPETNELRYTADSWAAFVKAYDDAKAIMAACNDSDVVGEGYDNSAVVRVYKALDKAVEGLTPNEERVDTVALMAVIATVQNDFIQVFTDETWNPLVAKIQEAKNAVWKPDGTEQEGESVYGVKDKALRFTDGNQEIVNNYVDEINALIKNLRFSTSVVVTTSEGKYSLDSAIALGNSITDPGYYGNYSVFSSAVATATDYATNTLPYQEMTDYQGQLDALKAEIAKVVKAFRELTKAFTRISDGEIANAGQFVELSELTQGRNNNRYAFKFQFSYPNNVIVFKTTHEAKSYKFGDALIRYTINLDDNVSKPNNGLDSITIDTQETGNGNAAESGALTNKPKGLSGTQKEQYKHCLAVDGFSLTNFRFHSQANNALSHLGRDNSGNTFTSNDANASEKIYEVLSQTNGESSDPPTGILCLRPSLEKDAVLTIAGDFNIDTKATDALAPLSETTLPKATQYSLTDRYVGAVYAWNVQPSGAYAGYGFFSYKDPGEPLNANVTVVDISYLLDLVNQCNTIADDADMYTLSSWGEFQKKLIAAQANMNYNTLSGDQIETLCIQRYTELFNAYNGLQLRAYNSSILAAVEELKDLYNTNNAEGIYTEDSWNNFVAAYNTASSTVADDGIYSNTNIKEVLATEQNTVDAVAAALINAKNALVKVADIAADWTAYNVALQNLKNLIVDYKLSVATLNAIVSQTADMLYTAYTAIEQASENGSIQPQINSETASLVALYSTVKADADAIKALEDAEVYDAAKSYADDYSKIYGNDDMWAGNNETFSYSQAVAVPLINDSVQGMIYTDAASVDAAVAASLNSKEIRVYTISLNGNVVGTAQYGESVIVDADGTFHNNVADTSENSETADMSDWFYSYSAPSTKNTETNSKYILTAPSYGFVVKGNTFLDTKISDKTDSNYCIKFVAKVGGTSKLFDVQYSQQEQVKVPTAPNYAGYKFTGFTNDAVAGRWITVDGDMTIVANYELVTNDKYEIAFYDGLDALENDEITELIYASYNELVVMPTEQDDVYCWAISEYMDNDFEDGSYVAPEYPYELTVIHYGSNYSFYACQNIYDYYDQLGYSIRGVVALTYEDYVNVFKSAAGVSGAPSGFVFRDQDGNLVVPDYNGYDAIEIPDLAPSVSVLENVVSIYDSNDKLEKFSMIGTFTLPDGYEMVETGFLFTSQLGKDLKIENVGTNGIARMKTNRYTVGNQFVVNVMAPSRAVSFEFVGYAVIKDSNGNVQTIYSAKGGETNYAG